MSEEAQKEWGLCSICHGRMRMPPIYLQCLGCGVYSLFVCGTECMTNAVQAMQWHRWFSSPPGSCEWFGKGRDYHFPRPKPVLP